MSTTINTTKIRKKSQISNELLLLFGLVIVAFLVLYSFNFFQAKAFDMARRSMELQSECDKLADEITMIYNLGNTGSNFVRSYENDKYDYEFVGKARQLSVKDSSAIATCKLSVLVRNRQEETEFLMGTGKLMIQNQNGKIHMYLGSIT